MFRIQFPGDVNVKKRLTDKFVSAKEQIQRNSKEFVTNSNVLEILLDSYFGGKMTGSDLSVMLVNTVQTGKSYNS